MISSYLKKRGDQNVDVGAWVSRDASDTYSGEVFKWVRDLTYLRNRAGEMKYANSLSPPPPKILSPCCQSWTLSFTCLFFVCVVSVQLSPLVPSRCLPGSVKCFASMPTARTVPC